MSIRLPPPRACARRLGSATLLSLGLLVGASAQTLPVERQTRHALIIGIGAYDVAGVPALRGVVHDIASARRMARAMAVPDGQVTVLRDREATGARIVGEIAALHSRMAEGDRVFVYFSGHGTRWYEETQSNRGVAGACNEGLLAADGQVLTSTTLGEALAPLARRADKLLVFYDAGFAGGVSGVPLRTRSLHEGAELLTPKFALTGASERCTLAGNVRTHSLAAALQRRQALPQNVVHVAASAADEVSFDSSASGGVATVAWRDCLLGQAQDLDGSGGVTVQEVTRCAQARVDRALAGQPDIQGQTLVTAGNVAFVPAWPGMAPGAPAASAPLAATPATAPARPGDILAELHGQRDGSRSVVASVRQPRMRIGVDALQIDVTPSRDGHLYIALAGSDGQSLVLLYPNDLAVDNRVRAGQTLSLPGKDWEIVAAGPPGTETLLVMVSDAPRDLAGLSRQKAGPFMKTLLDEGGRARLQWVLGNGTPTSGCGQAGAPSCSDAFGAALLRVESVR
jgi:Domain of unknown function (DUF4384)/Caspase domain